MIDDITKTASLTKRTLYCHFKSKEDLLKRIIEEYENRFLDGLINSMVWVKGRVLDKFEKYIRCSLLSTNPVLSIGVELPKKVTPTRKRGDGFNSSVCGLGPF